MSGLWEYLKGIGSTNFTDPFGYPTANMQNSQIDALHAAMPLQVGETRIWIMPDGKVEQLGSGVQAWTDKQRQDWARVWVNLGVARPGHMMALGLIPSSGDSPPRTDKTALELIAQREYGSMNDMTVTFARHRFDIRTGDRTIVKPWDDAYLNLFVDAGGFKEVPNRKQWLRAIFEDAHANVPYWVDLLSD